MEDELLEKFESDAHIVRRKESAPMPLTKRLILCVDDNEDNCFMLTNLLGRGGYEAKSAESMEQALEFAHRDSFNLYVLDSWLAKGSGVDLCQKIREFDPQTPIIFYSGAAYETDRQEALRAGANAFVAKPHIDELLQTVTRLLS
jgi:CheY-like chemotaxis protein